MFRIKNRDKLISNGGTSKARDVRALILDGFEASLIASDASMILSSKVKLVGDRLSVNSQDYDLKKFERIFVVGTGKAVGSMAEKLENLLEDRIEKGIVMVPTNLEKKPLLRRVKLVETHHPTPSQMGLRGARQITELVEQAGKNDLIIALLSGGGSALLPLPAEGISLVDKANVSMALMKSGANIHELNVVRKHLSHIKGGWMARKAYPARMINLILSDVVGDSLDSIASGPTSPDPSTFHDAENILKRYDVWKTASEGIRRRILDGEEGIVQETPKPDDRCFTGVRNHIIGNNKDACRAAVNLLSRRVKAHYLNSLLEGEAKLAGAFMGSLVTDSSYMSSRKIGSEAYVCGGETTVTVKGSGIGGRNMEIALGAGLKIFRSKGVAVGSMGTDGIDGVTDAAGAIVDGNTVLRGNKRGLDALDSLERNDTYNYFKALGDLIFTGTTGTNLNDVCISIAI